jgi:hypothetical protein
MAEAASGGRTWWAHFEFTRINIEPIILKNKIEDVREVGAPESFQVDDAKTGMFVQLTALLRGTRQPVEMSSNRPG